MLNKEQMTRDIGMMDHKKRYNHAMSALDTLMNSDSEEAKEQARTVLRCHVKIFREAMLNGAKMP